VIASDFAVPGRAEKLLVDRPDVIFHLAAIVRARPSSISTRVPINFDAPGCC